MLDGIATIIAFAGGILAFFFAVFFILKITITIALFSFGIIGIGAAITALVLLAIPGWVLLFINGN